MAILCVRTQRRILCNAHKTSRELAAHPRQLQTLRQLLQLQLQLLLLLCAISYLYVYITMLLPLCACILLPAACLLHPFQLSLCMCSVLLLSSPPPSPAWYLIWPPHGLLLHCGTLELRCRRQCGGLWRCHHLRGGLRG